MITSMSNRCATLQTDPELTRILIDGLHTWFNSDETIMPNKYPAKYKNLIRQQNRIGWRQLFSGRFSCEWARHQNDYQFVRQQRRQDTHVAADDTRYSQKSDRRSGHTWTTAIIQEMWERWFEAWAMRNADVHGHDPKTRQEQREHNNIMRLQTLYDQRQNMEPRVSDELLYENIEEHIQQSRHTLQNWLAVHESTIIQSIKQATKRAIQGVRLITSYFSSGRPPDTPATTPQPERNSTKHNDNKSKGVSPSEESPNLVSCGPLGVSGGSCG